MELEKVIETYGIDPEDLEGNDWYIVEKSEFLYGEVIGDLCIKAEDCISANKYNNCYEYDNTMYKTFYYFKPKNQKDYIVIEDRFMDDLIRKVRIKLEEGYDPVGGVFINEHSDGNGGTYRLPSQAMYRKGD